MPLASLRSVRSVARPGAPGQLPGQPVVRQADRGDPGGVLRLVPGQPAQLGHGEAGHRHDADRVGPGLPAGLAAAELRRSGRRRRRRDRVSFHSSAGRTTSPSSSRHDHAVLLAGDRDGRDVVQTAGLRRSPACSAAHQASGCTSVPSGCGARPCRTSAPVSASRMTTLQDWVEESTPATSVMAAPRAQRAPRRCSTASWCSRRSRSPARPAASTSKSSNALRSASRSA